MNQDIKNNVESIISNPNSDEREILSQLKQLIYEVELQDNEIRDSRNIAELVSESIKQLQGKTNQGNSIKSGFTEFDKMFGGFGLGELVVIGARPSMGKTQLLVNLSLNISISTPVLYLTFDLSELLLTNRFISSLSGIEVNKILQQELTDEQKENLTSMESKFAKHKILVNDSCNNSIIALKAHCQKHILENGVKVIVVDYLQMMSTNKYRHSRELEISLISRELKNIAKDFNVCVIATSQLSRAVETRIGTKRPQLSDLRESGAIEQDADKVIFIYRPEYYGLEYDEDGNDTSGLTELILAKNRNGRLGTVKLLRDKNFTNYRDFDQYKNDFSFSPRRLDELAAKNQHTNDKLGLEEKPF
ncbi:replicative DNA helicase [Pedobacter glucosidilyticus]|nr:DnaB-like helicase C-terminal domain-containing protein [Pedobacter glucosidilyticus]KHJ37785.1 replicative DNA helicase [Pedobacter glucosidilyticus]